MILRTVLLTPRIVSLSEESVTYDVQHGGSGASCGEGMKEDTAAGLGRPLRGEALPSTKTIRKKSKNQEKQGDSESERRPK